MLEDNKTQGLSTAEVEENRRKYGENILTPPAKTSLWKLYLEKFQDPIIRILLIAACVSLALAFIENNFIETIGIFVAVFLATTIGFYFERDAAKKFAILNTLEEEQPVKVRRNGVVQEVMRKDIVVGDTILVETGDEIPADARLIETVDLQVNESALTGELITTKQANPTQEHTHEAYPPNIILRSSMVMSGRGVAIVTAVGDETEIGKVSKQATKQADVKTPLSIQLEKLAKFISKVGTSVAVLAFLIFVIHDLLVNPLWHSTHYFGMLQVILKYFMFSVTVIVMAVPEGLPMAVTLALALNMRRMLKANNLVRKLHAAETMGAVTVICTDKTGTLTQNKMTVGDVVCYNGTEKLFVEAIAANTTAELNAQTSPNNSPSTATQLGIGNPTEVALLLWCKEKGYDYTTYRNEEKIQHQLPFSTERKYMGTLAMVENKPYVFVKGAPEVIMQFCNTHNTPLNEAQNTLQGFQNKAMRTLAFAYKELKDLHELETETLLHAENLTDMTLQAIVSISDPIRLDVPTAVSQCQTAGINIKMVTGDTSATAIQIAKEIGIWQEAGVSESEKEQWHITGTAFAALSHTDAYDIVDKLKVMSRARPSDKQRLVELLKERNQVVAVTGDGTNDAPALNHAHVGLSLGSGTSVAKEASAMTLLDDSFSSITQAVMWGRSLYKNIQRFLYFQLVVNLTALLLVLGGSVIGTEMPLTVTQILWVNLIMDTFAAMALASLPPSLAVLREMPRKATDFIISKAMFQHIVISGLVFFAVLLGILYYYEHDADPGVNTHELTIFFTVFVMIQLWNLLNAKVMGCCSSALKDLWKEKALLMVIAIIFIGQIFIVSFGGQMFRTTPLTLQEWVVITAGTSIVLWFEELIRWFKRKSDKACKCREN